MHQRPHAALGASTLTTSWSISTPRPHDAARSIALVGRSSIEGYGPSDPITAARRWLADPVRCREIDPKLRDRALQAVDVAESHMRALDEIAVELARQFDLTGHADTERVVQADAMATSLMEFSDRLRTLLDPKDRVEDATERLERGLEAASAGGGLRALVDAI